MKEKIKKFCPFLLSLFIFFPLFFVCAIETGAPIGNFSVNEEEICKENGKPIIYFFGSESCPHCRWEKPIFEKVTKSFEGYISFHENIDSRTDADIFPKYSTGGIPALVLGCKYYRVGSGEDVGEEQEEKNLTAIICKLTNSKPESICGVLPESIEKEQISSSKEFVGILAMSGTLRDCPSLDCKITRYYAETAEIKIVGLDDSKEWYQVKPHADNGNELNGWMYYSLFTQDFRSFFSSNKQPNQESTASELTSVLTQEEKSQEKSVVSTSFFKNEYIQIILIIIFVFIIIILSVFFFRKKIKDVFQLKLGGFTLPRIKFKQKSFVTSLPIILAITLGVAGISYGAFGYNKTSKIIKEAEQLSKEEKYDEANEKLEIAQNKLFGKIILKQKISAELDANKKLLTDKTKYDEGVRKLNEGNLQESIDLLSELPENSFYYQKAQTKIEESKRKMVEGELSKETTAKLAAQAEANQQELEKNIKEQQLSLKEAEEKRMNADNDKDGLTYAQELALGTSDLNPDSDGDGIPDKQDMHPAGGDRLMAQHFEWDYSDTHWTWDYSFSSDWYDYYKNKYHGPHGTDYVTGDDARIKEIAVMLKKRGEENGYSITEFASAFIQSLGYVSDATIGYNDYPKYPLETLAEQNGDCEDTSYLAAAIIKAMNIDCALVELPGHMAIAIAFSGTPDGYYYYDQSNGRNYYYMETTGSDWPLGAMPNEFRNTSASLVNVFTNKTSSFYPQYIKPCDPSTFSGYYYDGSNYYSDSQCNNLTNCIFYKDFYVNPQTLDFYWDNSCFQIVVKGCSKSTSYPGYFTNGADYYSDSRCIQRASICRPYSAYLGKYWDGVYSYWDSDCTQRVVSWCSKSTYHPGYFFNVLDSAYYYDYQCTQKADL